MTLTPTRKAALLTGLPIAMALTMLPASAQAQAGMAEADPAPAGDASSNAMVNLVRLLVARGTLSAAEGEALIAEALREAQVASAPAQMPPPPAGTIRVPYVPETVRQQIKDELRGEVLAQARSEGWASPQEAAPEWVRKIDITGDIRVRSQTTLQGLQNSTQLPNFAAIVAAGPLDLINDPIPLLNTTTDRYNELNLRARLGLAAELTPRVRAGFQIATGDDGSPVAVSTTLGGGFGKRDLYLDLAFIEARPLDRARLIAGRFRNPFTSTDALFDNDLRFDGLAAEIGLNSLRSEQAFNVVARGGAFPLDFGTSDFPDTAVQKIQPPQRYLFSGQLAANLALPSNIRLSAAVAYHDFVNIQGRPSAPCPLYLGVSECSTDGTAAGFVQKGNSLSFVRRIVLNPNAPTNSVQPQPQLLGLVMDYNVLDVNLSARFPVSAQVEASLTGSYLRNLAFDRADACRFGLAGQPVNNGVEVDVDNDGDIDSAGNICAATNPARFVGGGTGYHAMAAVGYPTVDAWGEWRVFAGYKYLESDVVLDSLTDNNFHLGGTNAKGFILGGQIGLTSGVRIGGRWLSANEVAGDPLSIDVLQVDVEAEF